MGSDDDPHRDEAEDEQNAPLLGPPKLPEFDAFMESSVLHGDGKATEAAPTAAAAPPQHTAYEVPEAFRGAPRFMNIPELPSASAAWHSPNMRAVFVLTLVVSIFEIVLSLPLALALVGILAVVAGILGIIAASNNLCEACQGPVMDSNVAVIRILTIVALAMDGLFLGVFYLLVLPVTLRDNPDVKGLSAVLIWSILVSPSIVHVGLGVVVLRKAAAFQRVLHPVQPGTIVVS